MLTANVLPEGVDADDIAEDAMHVAFEFIGVMLRKRGYEASGDIAPGDDEVIRAHFQDYVRMVALNNPEIARLNDEGR